MVLGTGPLHGIWYLVLGTMAYNGNTMEIQCAMSPGMEIQWKSNENEARRIILTLPQHHIGEAECMEILRKSNENDRHRISLTLPQHHIGEAECM